MTYKVIAFFVVRTKHGNLTLNPGQTITLAEEKAEKLITEGKIKPIGEPKQGTFHNKNEFKFEALNERMCLMGENTSPAEIKPYVTDFGVLVIPWNSDPQYHYWAGGQSLCDTLRELGRCDLIENYKSIYN